MEGYILFYLREGVTDYGEENGHEADVDNHDVGEEEERPKGRLCGSHSFEVEGTEGESEHGLRCSEDVVVSGHHMAEQQIGRNHEGRKV